MHAWRRFQRILSMPWPRKRARWWLWAVTALAIFPAVARAGGGPENVFLVVNPRSVASLTVANHFIDLRQIPTANVFYLDWTGPVVEPVRADEFRSRILEPVLQSIRQRGLASQIDYVVYSADFPTSVDLRGDIGNQQLPEYLTPFGSINGMTYLHAHTLNKDLRYLDLRVNQYMRRRTSKEAGNETHGFRSWYGWGDSGEPLDAGGQRYLLSNVLAVTSGRGNSVPEVIKYLTASAGTDTEPPDGTFYYVKNNDIRSSAREPGFAAAVAELHKLGAKAEIVEGRVPQRKDDIVGLMAGTPNLLWQKARSTILPGAICEHLTSFGGKLSDDTGQSPLTEFLRYGAAGASGTVTEPYLITDKFPSPMLLVHYARGASLLEAFYQSVHGPYQLLIVGDPLCQPWADVPQVTVEGLPAESAVSGTIALRPQAKTRGGVDVDRFELYVDGTRRATCLAGETLDFDTAQLVDGFHDLRVVAVGPSLIETQGRWLAPLHTSNFAKQIEFTVAARGRTLGDPPPRIPGNLSLTLSASSPGAKQIHFFHHSRLLGTVRGDRGEIEVLAQSLGAGPVQLRAIAVGEGGSQGVVVADPIRLEINEPPPLPRLADVDWESLKEGLLLETGSGNQTVITETKRPNWLETAGGRRGQPFRLSAYLKAKYNGVHYFQIRHTGQLQMQIDGHAVYDNAGGSMDTLGYVPVSLQAGVHRVEFTGRPGDPLQLQIRFGGEGTWLLSDKEFRTP